MPRNHISKDLKERLVEAYNRGEDYVELARQLGIKRTSAYTIIRRSQESPPRNGWGGYRGRKLDEEMIQAAIIIIEDFPAYTLDQILAEIRQRLPDKPIVTRSTLSAALNGRLIFLKKLEECPQERNCDRTKNLRHDFAVWLMNDGVNRPEIVFIDESGINLYTVRTRGRARRGERAVRVVNGRRGPNFSLCFAISSTRGLIHHTTRQGGMTSEAFVEFLECLSPLAAGQAAFVFDNAPAHLRVRRTRPSLQNGQSLHFLPPYSPMLNIAEHAISTFKAALKRDLEEARPALLQMDHQDRMAHLAGLAEVAVAAIQPHMAANWLRRMQRFIPACIRLEDIIM